MPAKPLSQSELDRTLKAFKRNGGNITATARELKLPRPTIQSRLKKSGNNLKPLAAGTINSKKIERVKVVESVHRFILTSAQNNTYLNDNCWNNLLALSKHYNAEILVGTYSYNTNAYGKLAVKRGTKTPYQSDLWYDPRLMPYIEAGDNRNIEIGPHLMWCGRANVLPTAIRPLQGFENYSGRHSGIFPHAKQEMESIAAVKTEATKFNYTTGTVTQQNYIQKKAGLKAEQSHTYGGLIVEVCKDGRWYVRQLVDVNGVMCDLNVKSVNGKITTGNRVIAINWGDVHCATLQQSIYNLAFDEDGMLDLLHPQFQFFHDTLDWKARDLHAIWKKLPRDRFINYVLGFNSVEEEIRGVANFFKNTQRPWCQSVVVSSNHDDFFCRWLDYSDHKNDPINARFYLHASAFMYDYMWQNKREPHMLRWACERIWEKKLPQVRFLELDESFVICRGQRGGIECGMHGNHGPNGSFGSEIGFERMGRRVNVGHRHSAGLRQWGVAYAGLLGNLDQGYNHGPGSWSQTQIVTYETSARAAITFWKDHFKA